MWSRVLGAAALLAATGTSTLGAQQAAPLRPAPALDRANFDTTCAACANFYRYANGGWMKQASIPTAYPMWGSYHEALDRTQEVLHRILESARRDTAAAPGSNIVKLGTFYSTCMDSARAEADGIAPLQPWLDRVATITTADGVKRTVGELRRAGVGELFGFGEERDPKDNSRIIASAYAGGLGLPDRDYYMGTDSRSRRLRKDYIAHVAKMLALAGQPAPQARRDAGRVMALETRLATASMTRAARRDPDSTYHRMAVAEVQALTPHFDWVRFLQQVGAPPTVTVINVEQPAFFHAVDRLFGSVPVATWKAYLRWHLLDNTAFALGSALANEDFRFARNFTGVSEQPPRWRRCLDRTSGAMGEALGREYVTRAFPPEAKARMSELVGNLTAALRDRIGALEWMSDSTKLRAIEKLKSFRAKVGYPDRWHDYSTLEVEPASFLANVLRAGAWDMARGLNKIGKPVDRSEWEIPPQTVDAMAGDNEIVFPAGILQPPYFDLQADDAVNYGAIGAVIGHEMTHHFDDQGRKFDANGNLHDWWTPTDVATYERRAALIRDQFNAYTVLDGNTHVNGQLTLGENIADLGGIKIAYDAFKRALAAKGGGRTIGGFTPEQRFFLAYARMWRRLARPEYLRAAVTTDPHSPWNWRVNGSLSNLAEFAEAFHCKPGDAMVRPDSVRAQVW